MSNSTESEVWDYLLDNEIVSEETLRIVTCINGFNVEALESIIYASTGYRSLDQLKEYI